MSLKIQGYGSDEKNRIRHLWCGSEEKWKNYQQEENYIK
jgi:hypothetical protein